jgi:hypothetical protein
VLDSRDFARKCFAQGRSDYPIEYRHMVENNATISRNFSIGIDNQLTYKMSISLSTKLACDLSFLR